MDVTEPPIFIVLPGLVIEPPIVIAVELVDDIELTTYIPPLKLD